MQVYTNMLLAVINGFVSGINYAHGNFLTSTFNMGVALFCFIVAVAIRQSEK